jgi:NAD dependent epimerase/dehydratase family enzyme
MGKLLKRPSFFPVPAFVLKIILGKAAEATLASQRVIPQKLIDSGFNFSFPLVKDALKNLLGK